MKRNLFAELNEGFQALQDQREGKVTLREHQAELHSELLNQLPTKHLNDSDAPPNHK